MAYYAKRWKLQKSFSLLKVYKLCDHIKHKLVNNHIQEDKNSCITFGRYICIWKKNSLGTQRSWYMYEYAMSRKHVPV